MPGIFSFIKHPMLYLLESASGLISGVDKIVAVYFDHQSQKTEAKGIVNPYQNNQIIDYRITSSSLAEKLRSDKVKYRWLSPDDLPFETKKVGKSQFDIFDEFERVVLCTGFENPADHKTDLLFIYLNKNLGNFGVAHSDRPLSTNEKSIIGNMTYQALLMLLQKNQNDSETLKFINQKISNFQLENEKLKRELRKVNANYQKSLIEHCHEHLVKLSEKFQVQFGFDEEALDKLRGYQGNIEAIKKQITEAAIMAINLSFGSSPSQITLKAWDISFPEDYLSTDDDKASPVPERYQKTFYLLDKLEHAAQKVVQNQLRLTSENVGNACPTAISAPAITDALRNHQKKVVSLMQQYPENWATIRNEFRPVKNILQDKTG